MSTTSVEVGQDLPRFWAKVDKSGDCWNWTATTARGGYGHFKINGKMKYAHRVAYELTIAPIPEGLEIDHRCMNRACVNPSHMRTVTRRENLENLQARKGSYSGKRGVYWSKRERRWEARVESKGVTHFLGYFATAEEADLAAIAKRNELLTYNDLDRRDAAA